MTPYALAVRFRHMLAIAALSLAVGPPAVLAAGTDGPQHGFALNHPLKYSRDFSHFDYANPDAPKGGSIVREGLGSFDSLNPFIARGNPAAASGAIYDTLMAPAQDEDSAYYGLLAETIEVPDDESWVEFRLRRNARFHDGAPVTAADVKWTFDTLREHGAPLYRFYYANVEKAEVRDEHTIRFWLQPGMNKELPMILGQVSVLPKHYWADRDFTRTTLEPPLGSGAYRIGRVDPGKSITLERVEDYWGRDLGVNRGHDNIDTVRFDYYRDRTVSREAFKAGNIDIWPENSARAWATAFDVPAVRDGRILLEEFPHERVAPMQGYVYNLRNPLFQDSVVREALTYAWDYEYVNKTIMYEAYKRTNSYFDNHELGAQGLPSPEELEILEPFRDRIPGRVFTEVYDPPSTDGSGSNRENLRTAFTLLKDAGWEVRNRVLTHSQTGQVFRFEILLRSDALVPHTQVLVQGLRRLGIEATIRVLDDAAYRRRMDSFDFDMTVAVFGQSVSPGNEQREYWGSEAAAREGSRNIIGIRDPVIDELIELLIAAPDRESLITRTRALDRVLLWNHFLIPMYHGETDRLAFWNRFGQPDVIPKSGVNTNVWWIDPDKDAALNRRRGG